MIEIFGIVAVAMAVVGVMANNRRLRWCFVLWLVSNGLTLAIHVDSAIWSLAARDAIFIALAVEGWFKWGKSTMKETKDL